MLLLLCLYRIVHDAINVYARKGEVKLEIFNSVEMAATSFYEFVDESNDRTLVPHLKAFHDAMTKMFPNRKKFCSENPTSEIGEICSYFGTVLTKYGDFFSVKGFYAASLEIRVKLRGSNHIFVAMSYNNLGSVHKDLGDLQQAKQYYEKALHNTHIY